MLVIVITASLDFASVLSQFGQLEESIHDGVRYATSISSLETGEFQGLTIGVSPSCTVKGASTLHQMLQNRVLELIRTNSKNLDFSSVCINSWVEVSPTGGRRLKLKVQVNYNGVFPAAANLPLTVEAMGPML